MRALTIALCLLASPALSDVAGVASVIDGDTMEIHGQRIRLHGIDAPESRQLCRLDGKSWQCGEVAADALADKIARRSVTCEDLGRDRYDRVIARCTVAGEEMGAAPRRRGFPFAPDRALMPAWTRTLRTSSGRLLGMPRQPVGITWARPNLPSELSSGRDPT